MSISATDLHWLAGVLDGEGSFYSHTKKSSVSERSWEQISVRMSSTDKDTVKKVHKIAGGYFYGPYGYKDNRKPYWQWQLHGLKAYNLMKALLPLMCFRRARKIESLLSVFEFTCRNKEEIYA